MRLSTCVGECLLERESVCVLDKGVNSNLLWKLLSLKKHSGVKVG